MKIAIITGGSRGLGKNMSLHLAQKGHDIILTYNSKQPEAMDVVDILKKEWGRIINVSSGLSRFFLPGYAAYGTMKGGIETLTRYMAEVSGGVNL